MQLLPPSKDKCQCCAFNHPPTEPHNAQTLYYHFWFEAQYNRAPTWADAMAHCSEQVQQKWMSQFIKCGVDIYSTNLLGDIKSQEEVSDRLRR
ncbi:MAG: hypothetical protein AB1589_22850 [Cyanobacteriota bacterium]